MTLLIVFKDYRQIEFPNVAAYKIQAVDHFASFTKDNIRSFVCTDDVLYFGKKELWPFDENVEEKR